MQVRVTANQDLYYVHDYAAGYMSICVPVVRRCDPLVRWRTNRIGATLTRVTAGRTY
jgi:hypothetical protein